MGPNFRGRNIANFLPGAAVVAVVLAIGLPTLVERAPERSEKPGPDAPGRPTKAESDAVPHVFRLYQENPTTLDPALAADAYSSCVVAQIYSPLVGLTADLEPTPHAAESWTISPDGRRYVFHLRPGVRFHNGREVSAKDFEYSITRVFREPFRSEGLAAGYLDAIEGAAEFMNGKARAIRGIRVLDKRRLEIRLVRPYGALLSALALDQTAAVPREIAEPNSPERIAARPVGSGPFRFVRRDARQIVLAANDDYFMGRPAGIDTLVFFAPLGDVTAMGADALLEGHATMSQLPTERIEEFRARHGIAVLKWHDLSLAFIGMNCSLPPLDDIRVRQAIALAMDRAGMLSRRPEGRSLATGILPPGLPGYGPAQKAYTRDVAAARALLAKAGYGPRRPLSVITLWRSAGSSDARGVDTVLVRSLAEAGIRVKLRYEPWAILDSVITARKAALFSLSWIADIPDPDTFLRALFYSSSSTNYFRYKDRLADSLLDLARATPDPGRRMDAYRKAEERILRAAPFVPLYHTASFIGMREDVAGLEMNPLGISTLQIEKLRFEHPQHGPAEPRASR